MKSTIRKIWDVLSTIIVVLAVVLAIAFAGARLLGFNVFMVLSGSMEPAIETGSLIYIKKIDCNELKSGDVITFMLSKNTVATHRIVDIIPDETDPTLLRFQTKGDANNSVDGAPVHCQNVLGTPIFTIPKLGYLASYIQQPPGSYLAVAIGAALVLFIYLPGIFMGDDKKKKEPELISKEIEPKENEPKP